jgi:hypothetical protein
MKLSGETRSLLAAARSDEPSRAMRESTWKKLELGLAVLPTPAPSGIRATDVDRPSVPSSPPAAPPAASPSGPIGALRGVASYGRVLQAGFVGGAVGGGVAAVLFGLASRPHEPKVAPELATFDHARGGAALERGLSAMVSLRGPSAEHGPGAIPVREENDRLGREVAMIMAARKALLGGDPTRARAIAQTARSLHGQLEVEALTLEMRALRALDRGDEADRLESELRVLRPR